MLKVSKEDSMEKVTERGRSVVWDVLAGVPHLESITRRHRREKMQPWQMAALPPSHQVILPKTHKSSKASGSSKEPSRHRKTQKPPKFRDSNRLLVIVVVIFSMEIVKSRSTMILMVQ